MRSVIGIRGLRILDVLSITSPGRLEGFASATSLETFRGNHYLTEEDLLEVTTCKSLREIGIQNAALSSRALEALLALPRLETLDVEATVFDDAMAKRISTSKHLRSLDVGATKLSRRGLMYICRMRQLRSLDLWATRIEEEDVELLSQLPNLEYVSIGDAEGNTKFNAKTLLPRLAAIRSLQRVWLDGVIVSPGQKAKLESRFSTVRVT
jgi:Leucine-rich repeat (LRR) protein